MLKINILLLSMPATSVPVATWQRLAQDYAAATRTAPDREDNETGVLSSLQATLDVMAMLAECARAGADAVRISMFSSEPTCESRVPRQGCTTVDGTEKIVKAVSA